MIITRTINGKDIEISLTAEEIAQAHDQYVLNFMKSLLITKFEYNSDIAEELAHDAYQKYYQNDRLTEYECVKWASDRYEEIEHDER